MWDDYQNISIASMKGRKIEMGKGHFFLFPPLIGGFLLKSRDFGESLHIVFGKFRANLSKVF